MNQIRIAATVALAGIALVVIGCFCPWVTGEGLSRAGVDRGGQWLLYASVVVALLVAVALLGPTPARATRVLALPVVLLVLGLALLELQSAFAARLVPASGPSVPLDVSWGIWIVVAGAVTLGVGALMMLRPRLPRTAAAAAPGVRA